MNEALTTVIEYIIESSPQTEAEFLRARQKACSRAKVQPPPNRKLFQAYQELLKKKSIARQPLIEQALRKANIRSMSGIAVVTSLVKPYMCPGKCVYCPTEVRMPKSYIASEPAAARALRLEFSPYEQMRKRILMLEANGHPADKIEYIIKGGTWNAYPLKYQYWFTLESFRAANDLSRKKPTKGLLESASMDELKKALEKEQRYNEKAKHRIIGMTLETRPDAISPKTIYHMRQQGCTRIELGLQAPDDAILELIQRGHTVDQFRHAIKLLRDAGFKVDLHFMPDLPGTTPKHDVEMYKQLFEDPSLRPDMVKIYPNTVIPSAELYQWFKDGRYTPYGDDALFDALLEMKRATPRYCRISRLIRDIPANEIAAGNAVTNLREELAKSLKENGEKCACLRCREIGRHMKKVNLEEKPTLFTETYNTDGGTEYFLTLEDATRTAVYAFLRLRIPEKTQNTVTDVLKELQDCAFIRELHTYGQLVKIGTKDGKASQHKGLGKRLVAAAEKIVVENGYAKVAVISGVGVRGYYRKLGYTKRGTYMIKRIVEFSSSAKK